MNTPKFLALGAAALLGAFSTASALSVFYPGETQRGMRHGGVVILKPAPVMERHQKIVILEPKRHHHGKRVILVKPKPVFERHQKVIIVEPRRHHRDRVILIKPTRVGERHVNIVTPGRHVNIVTPSDFREQRRR